MTQQEILNSRQSKSAKMRQLFELGFSRTQVAEMLGVGYGFVQNVYAKQNGTSRTNLQTLVTPRSEFNFNFSRNFGVEIEAYNVDKTSLKRKLNAAGIETENEGYTHRTTAHWKIVSDGSLTGNETFELVSPILNGQRGLDQLQTVCRVLKEMNAKVNKSCGLHIHFDARGFELATWKKLYKNYAKLESNIDSFMPSSRRASNNTYCKSMKVSNYEGKINRARTLEGMAKALTNRNRYYKLNTESYWRHKSVEFRQHSGTIEFEKISNWILFLARFVEFSRNNDITDTSFEGMRTFLNDDIMNYLTDRKERLAA